MKDGFAGQYADLEKHHWWFRARRLILRSLLAREIPWRDGMETLEVGVGPGENLYTLYPPGIRLSGLEPEPANAEIARQRGAVPVYTGTVETMPAPLAQASFDVITLFDVLEHIRDDGHALDILRARLKPGGRLVLAVPAYQWLWGQQDVVSLHFRRYTMSTLKAMLAERGLRVTRATYFNTLLFPPIAAFRLIAKLRPGLDQATESDFKYNVGILNELLFHTFATEAVLTRYVSFPFGVSLFVVAESTP
ncbi:MAG: class I SAM-dependent methyltransferase [bacterium]